MVVTFAELLAEQEKDPEIKMLMDAISGKNSGKREVKERGSVSMDNILENMINKVVSNISDDKFIDMMAGVGCGKAIINSLDPLEYTVIVDSGGKISIEEGLNFHSKEPKEPITKKLEVTKESIESYAFLVQEYRNELTKINNDIESLLEEYKKASMQKIKLTEEINNASEDLEKLSLEATRAFYMCYNEPSNQSTLKEKLIEVEYKKNSINDLEMELRSENGILNSIPEVLEEKYCIKEEIEDFLESLNESLQKITSSFYI